MARNQTVGVSLLRNLTVILLSMPGLAVAVEFNPSAFDGLPKSDRIAVVLAGLREHAALFENADIALSSIEEGIEPNNDRSRKDLKFRIVTFDRAYRFEQEMHLIPTNGKAYDELVKVTWDGKTSKIWTLVNAGPTPGLVILGEQPEQSALSTIWYFMEQLGLRWRNPPHDSFADVLENLTSNGKAEWDVQSVVKDLKPLIKISLNYAQLGQQYEYTIDPSHQFIITRSYFALATNGKEDLSVDFVTDGIQQIGNSYIPSRFTRTSKLTIREDEPHGSDVTVGEHVLRTVFEVRDCKLGAVAKNDITAAFYDKNVSTHVVDKIKNEAYMLESNGSRVMRPLLNSRTGRVSHPSEIDQLTTSTSLAANQPVGAILETEKNTPKSNVVGSVWIIGTIVTCIGVVVGLVFLRTAKRVAQPKKRF